MLISILRYIEEFSIINYCSYVELFFLNCREFVTFLDEVKPPAEAKTDTMVTSSVLGIEYHVLSVIVESFYSPHLLLFSRA